MNTARLVICAALSLPVGWFGCVLHDRVPGRLPLFRPLVPVRVSGMPLAIQLLTTALFMAAAVRFQHAAVLTLAGYLGYFAVAVALSAIDLDTLRLPDRIVGGALVVSIPLLTAAALAERSILQVRFAVVGGAFYFVFLLVFHLLMPRGLGFGDVKMAALMGLYTGFLATSAVGAVSLVLYAMIAGFLTGSATGLVLFSFRRRSRAYPFGPFLLGGSVLIILVSQSLLPTL